MANDVNNIYNQDETDDEEEGDDQDTKTTTPVEPAADTAERLIPELEKEVGVALPEPATTVDHRTVFDRASADHDSMSEGAYAHKASSPTIASKNE